MSFASDVKNWTVKVEVRTQAAFVNTASHVLESIQIGSAVTGAPGQPVDTGNLRASWHLEFPSKTSALISTNVEYAPYIEAGVVPVGGHRGNATGHSGQRLTLRSAVGGFHSVALTRAGLTKIVAFETAKLVGGK